LPENLDLRGEERNISVENIEFFYDLTYKKLNGEIISEQTIFDENFSLIEEAKEYILIDAFLFNSYTREPDKIYRQLTPELTERLVRKKEANPDIEDRFYNRPDQYGLRRGHKYGDRKIKRYRC
jgi:hypothetical protein